MLKSNDFEQLHKNYLYYIFYMGYRRRVKVYDNLNTITDIVRYKQLIR